MISIRKQKGFSILAVILIVVGLIAIIGAWALSGQTNSQSASESTSDVLAAGIAQDAAAIKAMFDTISVKGVTTAEITYVPTNVAYGTSPNLVTNMLNTQSGIQKPVPNPNALQDTAAAAPANFYVYHKGIQLPGVGVTANAETMIVLSGLRLGTCQKINERNNGTAVDATPPASGKSQADLLGAATVAAPTDTTAADLTGVTALSGWSTGCTGTSDGKYVFFRVLRAQ